MALGRGSSSRCGGVSCLQWQQRPRSGRRFWVLRPAVLHILVSLACSWRNGQYSKAWAGAGIRRKMVPWEELCRWCTCALYHIVLLSLFTNPSTKVRFHCPLACNTCHPIECTLDSKRHSTLHHGVFGRFHLAALLQLPHLNFLFVCFVLFTPAGPLWGAPTIGGFWDAGPNQRGEGVLRAFGVLVTSDNSLKLRGGGVAKPCVSRRPIGLLGFPIPCNMLRCQLQQLCPNCHYIVVPSFYAE